MGLCRNLVFARTGKGSIHQAWAGTPRSRRNWDLQLSTYIDDNAHLREGDFPLSIDKGTKWDSVFRYFRNDPQLFDRYDYVFFPDDDIGMTGDNVNRVFDICRKHGLDIAQPALTPDSYFWHALLLKCPGFEIRYLNYIEPMCPCIRTEYLRILMPYLERMFTGWGLDLVWAMLMPDPSYRAAILDNIEVRHTRPFETGAIYSAFREMGVDPHQERSRVANTYKSALPGIIVYGGVTPGGLQTNGPLTRLMNGLHLLGACHRARDIRVPLRAGFGSLLRTVTMMNYLPSRIEMPSEDGGWNAAPTSMDMAKTHSGLPLVAPGGAP